MAILRPKADFMLMKEEILQVIPPTPQYAGDIAVKTARVLQIGSDVPAAMMDSIVVYFPTAGHTYRAPDGNEYILLRHTNVLAYYDN
jgi:hypothetical protein